MAEIIVTKGEDGKLHGLEGRGQRAYERFLRALRDLPVGDTLRFAFWIPRAPGPHRRHFKILGEVFKQQEQFDDFDRFREWLQIGAGFCDLVPGPKNNAVAYARSIAWHKLEEADFEWHSKQVMDFMRSTRATRFMWPEATDEAADSFINDILAHFGA